MEIKTFVIGRKAETKIDGWLRTIGITDGAAIKIIYFSITIDVFVDNIARQKRSVSLTVNINFVIVDLILRCKLTNGYISPIKIGKSVVLTVAVLIPRILECRLVLIESFRTGKR